MGLSGINKALGFLRLKPLARNIVSLIGSFEKPVSRETSPWERLNDIHPDTGKSCIGSNFIDQNPKYDIQVIIPVYNTESTVRQTIESVLNQKVKDCRTCITIVNDGSPDASAEILKEYEGKEGIEIINQENKGLSGARNRALQHIKARYVTFLDSDDYLPPEALQSLIDRAEATGADIVQGSYIKILPDNTLGPTVSAGNKTGIQSMIGFPWGKLFSPEIFRNLVFPEGYWFEDTLMNLVIFPGTSENKMVSTDAPVYCYRINPNGITQSAAKKVKIIDTLWVTLRLYNDCKIMNKSFRPAEYETFLNQALMNYNRISSYGSKEINLLTFNALAEMKYSLFPSSVAPSNRLKGVHEALRQRKAKTFFIQAKLAK
ncbi:MAG: glycosyltransferase family 2 protein [Muribaculaceae bacterium]|nr:glycosyltransferase family 2 protein [Muribaculaceae bacterium]